MKGKELLEVSEVRKLNIKDGDVLIIYCPREPTDFEVDCIRTRVREITGLDLHLMVMPPGYDMTVVHDERVRT